MNPARSKSDPPLLAKLLQAYLRSGLRGNRRMTFLLANKIKSLQSVPIVIADLPPIYVDLRFGLSHDWLTGSPWTNFPVEIDERSLVSQIVRPGDTVFDIGANLGLYTTLFSKLVGSSGRVYAFEPNPTLLPVLGKTIAALDNVKLLPIALSDHQGKSTLFVPNDHTMGSLADYTSAEDLADWRNEIGLERSAELSCELVCMDDLFGQGVITPPDFIKCDVEGAELFVFRGGRRVLSGREAPIILFEALEKCTSAFNLSRFEVVDFLSGLNGPGYQIWEIIEGGKLRRFDRSDKASPNLLAVPASRIGKIESLL